MKTSLQKADNYSLILVDGNMLAVFSINKTCYRRDVDGTLTPIAFGDEVAMLYGGKIAVRQGQNVKII